MVCVSVVGIVACKVVVFCCVVIDAIEIIEKSKMKYMNLTMSRNVSDENYICFKTGRSCKLRVTITSSAWHC